MRERAGLSFLPAGLAASLAQEEAGSGAWQDWLYSPSLAHCSPLPDSSLMSAVFFRTTVPPAPQRPLRIGRGLVTTQSKIRDVKLPFWHTRTCRQPLCESNIDKDVVCYKPLGFSPEKAPLLNPCCQAAGSLRSQHFS